ncbi:MAG: alpha amylase C-terminal domain-containing protein [Rikenellaceae bacterium]
MMMTNKSLPIIELDEWLKPSSEVLERRYSNFKTRLNEIESSCNSISDYANAHLYYGFNYDNKKKGWWFREWLPNAIEAFVYGDFNNWNRTEFKLERNGEDWQMFFPDNIFGDRILHEGLYKIYVHGDNGFYERIPAYARRVKEDVATHNFSAQIWMPPTPFKWTDKKFKPASTEHPIIYEAHIGMAQEQPRIGLYRKFTRDILPRIKNLGYNTLQVMAIAEHPYYGSFGYQVSNFFAPSSRFGTPDELKDLINTAHALGITVIMDLVHSHYVKNFNEGLNELDGSATHYSEPGERGEQPYWGSKTFDYGKLGVEHFLLSNIKYWLEEFHFDGFRFDGVTSMLYYHHGYVEFDCRERFFDDEVNECAVRYLTLANRLIHELKPDAISIAEDVSGMPGITVATEDGGIGFDFRMGMAIPDFWIKYLEDVPDEQWNIWDMLRQMTNRLHYVKTIGYAESHDQAMVGDKTIAFRLMDKEMYWNMTKDSQNIIIDRGIALHKMIRLFTITTAGQGYLTFMGNEFGHPQWIDFPREGNGYSFEFARRQWSLTEDKNLRYYLLQDFDKAMIELVNKYDLLSVAYPYIRQMDEENKTMAYSLNNIVFVLNWDGERSIPNYTLPVPEAGEYVIVLNSDSLEFGGFGRIDMKSSFFTHTIKGQDGEQRHYIDIYNVSRNALVLTLKDDKK